MSNERVEGWLRELGHAPEPEPHWVPGRKPDFFCRDVPLWVEVKTLGPTDYDQAQSHAWNDFRTRIGKIGEATGDVYAMTSQDYTEAAGKLGAHLVRMLAKSTTPPSAEVSEVIVIPPNSCKGDIVSFRYESRQGAVIQIGPEPASGRYGYYPSYDPMDWSQEVEIVAERGTIGRWQLYDVFEGDSAGPLSVSYCRSDTPLAMCALMSSGGYNTTAARIREVAADANNQLRSGQRVVTCPGICVIYHESLSATAGRLFLSALFGDVTVPIDLNPTRLGQAFLGNNGVLSPTKNRGISAVRYVTQGYQDSIVLNPYAEYPIEPSFFRSAVWMANGESMILYQPKS
jgi:hypothetical protein